VATNYIATKTSDAEGRKICIYLTINRKHKVVEMKLPTYPPDGRNQLQASENEFMTSAHEDKCSQPVHKCLSQFADRKEKLFLSL